MATLMENINRAITAFKNIKSAIEGKGIEVGNAPVEEYADRIAKISTVGVGQTVYYNSVNGRCYVHNVDIPETVESIGDYAYENSGVRTVVIAEGAESIGRAVFRGCSKLESVSLPSSVTSIGNAAFNGCSGLTSIYLGTDFNATGATFSAGDYSADIMLAMFEALKDNTGLEAKTLTLGGSNLAKLTEEQKQIATNKNWNLA